VKSLTIWALVGAILGIVAASFIVPPMLSWYNEAGYLSGGGQPQAVVHLPDVIRYATTRLIRGQSIGGAIGAVVFLAFGFAAGGRKRRAAVTPAATDPHRVPSQPPSV
jgi:hypothetical protein